MEYHRRMLHNFMVLNYVARKMINLYKDRIPYEVNRVNLRSDIHDQTKYAGEDILNEKDMLKYKLWLSRNCNNHTGRYRRFSDASHERNQELDVINVTGYALYQHPYKFNRKVHLVPKHTARHILIDSVEKPRKNYEENYKTKNTKLKSIQFSPEASKNDIGIKDITDIALTTLSFLSFGMFVLQVLTCLTAEKLSANSIIFTHTATTNTVVEDEDIEEIRRRKRSPITIPLKQDIIAQKSLRFLQLLSNTSFVNYSCFKYLICENGDAMRNQLLDHAFWIPIWSVGITWITNYKQITGSNPHYSSHNMENLKAIITGALGKYSCEINFKNAC
ncbi:uncharacterized protein LOC105219605 [Zeugodacus cucurbitae]|nr:uncharacterized protein LOC105219605 [Zeugodacus cucurbitae]